jgi:hypothetical protein
MKFEIKHRYSCAVLFSLETDSLKLCVEAAVKARADLQGADLQGADLRGADLQGADLRGAKNSELAQARTLIVPEGLLVVWKQCRDGVIVKLYIPLEAKRSNATGRKCRFEFADVVEVIGGEVGISKHDGKTEYRTGQRVACDKWDENRWNECSGGIHSYLTRVEAENN